MNRDLFISYASEDRIDVVQPLYDSLTQVGLRVWIDENDIVVGANLRKEIESGLADSRFGLVILSSAYMKKLWPQRELDALLALETPERHKILPIWHRLSQSDVTKLSPILATRAALTTEKGIEAVAGKIMAKVYSDRGAGLFETFYPRDREWFVGAKEIFNRSAWVGAYHGYTGQEPYQRVIKRTIKALNTGLIENADGVVDKALSSINLISDVKLNRMMLELRNQIKRIDNLVDTHSPYPGQFPLVVLEINEIRDEIIRRLNEVWTAFGIHTLPIPTEVTTTMNLYNDNGTAV